MPHRVCCVVCTCGSILPQPLSLRIIYTAVQNCDRKFSGIRVTRWFLFFGIHILQTSVSARALLRALFPHSQPNPVDAISISLFGTCPYFFRLVLLDLVVGNLILKPCIVWGLTETFKIFLNICVNVLSLIHSSLSLHSTCLSYQTDYCSVKTALFSSFQANSLVCLLYKCKQVA